MPFPTAEKISNDEEIDEAMTEEEEDGDNGKVEEPVGGGATTEDGA